MKLLFSLLFALALNLNFAGSPRANHDVWNKLLQENVTSTGKVDYKNLRINKNSISTYLRHLKTATPGTDWSDHEKMAYYINMYNAYIIQFIISKYPVNSVKDISYSGKDIWNIKLVKIGEKSITLNTLEGLLVAYKDPRIHFAINCGAKSCPRLMNKAFNAKSLDTDLTRMAKIFINDLSQNQIKPKKVAISKIFEWYKLDFTTSTTTLTDFLNKYSKVKIAVDSPKTEYLPYDWSLNE
jgi:predicted secreted protein